MIHSSLTVAAFGHDGLDIFARALRSRRIVTQASMVSSLMVSVEASALEFDGRMVLVWL